MNKPLVLVVEDDTPVRNLITTTLKTHEYRYLSAQNGASAVMEALSHNPDIVLLDLGLPDMDGVEIIRKIRSWSNMPIIVISARTEDSDKIVALDAGADDYLTKPFAIEELLARIRVALKRRGVAEVHTHRIEIRGVCMDTDRHEVTVCGEIVELTNREFELLRTLMENKDIVMDREKLLNAVCGYDYLGETNIIDVYVRYLRTKIDDRFGVKLITTVRGVGYVIRE